MSDASSAQISSVRRDWVSEHREIYLRSGGVQGHIEDITPVGGHAFATHCLVKYIGRKSGKIFITPLCYGDIGGEVVICASKGGADTHPEWYLNILEAKEIEFQVATQAFRATWREPTPGPEREKIWNFMVDCFPFYAKYQASTQRLIPLVMMKAFASIPVFKESDATGKALVTRQPYPLCMPLRVIARDKHLTYEDNRPRARRAAIDDHGTPPDTFGLHGLRQLRK